MKTHLKDHFNLHFIVFIWGFTAILGKYISISALDLVFNRTGLTALVIGLFLLLKKRSFKANAKDLLMMWVCGMLISLHWITFFLARSKFQMSASPLQESLRVHCGALYSVHC